MNVALKSLFQTIGFCLFFASFLYFIVWIEDHRDYQIYFWWGFGIVMFLYVWETFYTLGRIEKYKFEKRNKL